MRSGALTAVAGAMAIGLAACGGSSPSGLALGAYTVRGKEEPGYVATGAILYKTLQAAAGQGNFSSADLQRMKQEGFKGEAVENTGIQEAGLSRVLELGSVAGAERELRANISEDLHSGGAKFSVPTIPGAVGVAYPAKTGGGGGNVLFQEGRCFLLVGDEGKTASYRDPAIAGANAVWKRTHGRTGACSA